MRFRVSVLTLKLASQITASRLVMRTSYQRLRLSLGFVGVKLSVAVGFFVKFLRLQDAADVSEQDAKTVTKVVSPDLFSVSEFSDVSPRKNILNSVGFFDDAIYFAEDYVEGNPQTYTLGPQIVRDITKPLVEAISIASVPTITFNRSFNEAIFVADDVDGSVSGADITLDYFKSTDNIPAFVDQKVLSLSTAKADIFASIDTPEKNFSTNRFEQLLLADTPQIQISLPREELPTFIDENILSINPAYSDNPDLDDVGFLYSQGYTVDMTYFAEDYVGESRTFS